VNQLIYSSPARSRARRRSFGGFILIAIGLALSLGGIVRVSALPAEARTQETWFAYTQELNFDFTARVTQGDIYAGETVSAEELLKTRAAVEPPVYRRVLLSQLTDSITVRLPYRFTADRPATINASYRVDGLLVAANLWQRPYPLQEPKSISITGTELVLNDLVFTIPIREILQELDTKAQRLGLGHDQVDLRIRPVIKIDVEGQPEPVSAILTPEYVIGIRGIKVAIEIDEPKTVDDSKTFTATRVTPLTVRIFGQAISLSLVRTGSIVALTLLALVLGGVLIVKWVKGRMAQSADLTRLGSSLIVARSFDVPDGAALVDVQSVAQLVSIHLRTDRPVVQVGDTCYLVDGSTCYRLQVHQRNAGD